MIQVELMNNPEEMKKSFCEIEILFDNLTSNFVLVNFLTVYFVSSLNYERTFFGVKLRTNGAANKSNLVAPVAHL